MATISKTKTHTQRTFAIVVISFVCFLWSTSAFASTGDIMLEVMASPEGFAAGASPGHSFICIVYQLDSGIKEDCYGFYPKANGIDMFIGGPGLVLNEFVKNPLRFSVVGASFKKKISNDTRRAILTSINNFNKAKYKFTDSNCVDFVDSIVKTSGWKAPDRKSFQRPVDYVKAVSKLNP